jgi:hypothetical protein
MTVRASNRTDHRPRFRITGVDLSASITVFLLAVPVSLGLAVVIGAPLEAGLLAAATCGIVACLLGRLRSPRQRSVGRPDRSDCGSHPDLRPADGRAITIGIGLLQLLLGSLPMARATLTGFPAIAHGTLAGFRVATPWLNSISCSVVQVSTARCPGRLRRVHSVRKLRAFNARTREGARGVSATPR